MSLSNILQATTRNENWSTVNCFSVATNNLGIGQSPNNYILPTSIGSGGQVLAISDSINILRFVDNPIASLSFGGNLASATNYFKFNSPVNTSPDSNPDGVGTSTWLPYPGTLKYISYDTTSGIGNGQWVIRVNNTNVNVTLTAGARGIMTLGSPIDIPASAKITVGIVSGSTFPGNTNITLWVVANQP